MTRSLLNDARDIGLRHGCGGRPGDLLGRVDGAEVGHDDGDDDGLQKHGRKDAVENVVYCFGARLVSALAVAKQEPLEQSRKRASPSGSAPAQGAR